MTTSKTLTISCADCVFRCTAACDDCLVTFVLDTEDQMSTSTSTSGALVLDLAEQRVMRWLSNAGLVPDLQFDEVG